MTEFYEPMLMSTPEHPNTMGVEVLLKERVDGDILTEAVEELRTRFPYFYIQAVRKGNDLAAVPNPRPMIVRNTWPPVNFQSKASNYHLAAWKYKDKRLAFEISHSLTDGAGILPYIKSALFLYLSRKTGKEFDPSGFRLPGDPIPDTEIGNPFASVDIDGAEALLYVKKATEDFFRIQQGSEKNPCITYIKMPEAQVGKEENRDGRKVRTPIRCGTGSRRAGEPEGWKAGESES